ncbi:MULTISPECIES: ABC transporter permease [Clostridium]|uniref:ABC transporter membrane-spanning permease-sugar transport n=1 Tax=Clostridium butyricum E4 str. BoNT E BL5262 TaxID=632245 RepID=C4IBC6_CLOBU|nr:MULTISPECIES: ABC transporter permease subunit [Clostridium]APF21478.1 binding--dependent transport system inner membrane component family protein [Clostridium butyricum]EEP56391.1 ABC transporter membrane-spanning permease - sugar transport [Clostridium butyricum E4 str. BoNT E BL5262]KIU04910.1 ABC transporter membrane-spanning permease - sugar transport [Clostridium butyricum]MBA8968905.1 putative aldouronate transport system permease protein [Clostridium butyricum]MBA8973238.1 putative 
MEGKLDLLLDETELEPVDKKNRLRKFMLTIRRNKVLILMLLPAILYFLIFSYIPMGGTILAFKNYNFRDGIFGSPWVGLDNFKYFFISGQAWIVTRNTILYNVAFITVNTILQMGLAILISEIGGKYFKKLTQTAMFLPYFISWVVVGIIAYNMLNLENGTINSMIAKIGGEKFNFYGSTFVWPFIMIFVSAWKNVGYGTVLYLAAIMGIDTETYEAAKIDGANIFQRIFKVTIPSLIPTMIILTLLAIGNIFRGDFQMFYQIIGNNGPLFNATDVIDTFTFRSLIQSGEVGMSAASCLYQSVFCFITIMISNFLVKKYDKDYSLF